MSARDALWTRLRDASLVQGDVPAPAEDQAPWFVRVMLGIAGWIGAVFLLFFFGMAISGLLKNAAACIAVGAVVCAGAAVLLRVWHGDFASQFGFAFSLAGQALLAVGLVQIFEPRRPAGVYAGLFALQQTLLFAAVPNFSHRVWCACTASCAALFALGDTSLRAFGPAVITAAFLVVWLREFDHPRTGALRRAAGYGLAVTALAATVTHASWDSLLGLLIRHGDAHAPPMSWAGAAASGLVLVAAVVLLLRREGVPLAAGPGRIALAAAVVLAAVTLKAPGLGPAVSILVIGYANGNRVLAGVGIAALVGYLSHYYYSMQTTLLEKSALLAATGVALLLARLALNRWWPRGEAAHA